ncbi:MAG TPA: outer membrane beta-barrel protein [Gammaproteobacteria bacterium]
MPNVTWGTASALVATALGALGATSAAAQEPEREFISFVWGAGVDGRQGIGGRTIDVDADWDDLIDFVDVGASFRYRATNDGLGWFMEGNYTRLDSSTDTPTNASAELTLQLGELGFSKSLRDGLAVYAGLRAQSLDLEIRAEPGFIGGDDSSWVDGIVGLRWSTQRPGPWTAWVRGDIGAGESDRVWLGEIGGGYRFGGAWSAYLGYRVLSTDYEDDDFLYDVEQSGLAFGFGFVF